MASHLHELFPGAGIKRPAITETSFASEEACNTAKEFYAGLLGILPNTAQPPYLFPVVFEVALLLVVSDDGIARTTTYWELTDNTSSNLDNVYKELKDKYKCRHVKAPHKPAYAALLKSNTEICSLLDPSGSLFGLVINPPIPLV